MQIGVRDIVGSIEFRNDRLQISDQPSASLITTKGLETAAEFFVSRVSSHSHCLANPKTFSGDSGNCCPFNS